jgi:hypothetical protein
MRNQPRSTSEKKQKHQRLKWQRIEHGCGNEIEKEEAPQSVEIVLFSLP